MDGRTRFYILVAIIMCVIALFLGMRINDKKPESKHISSPKKMHVYEKTASQIPQGGPTQDQNFSQADLDQSKDIAIQFVKSYHNFDASNPLQNIENSKQFMSDDLYTQLKQNPTRGTLEAVKKQWTDINVTTTANSSKTKIIWNVVVQSENTDNDGNKLAGEDWILVQLEKINGQFKVTGVRANATP